MKRISFRGLLFFIKVSILVVFAAVLFHYPGEIHISWLGYHLETSPAVFIIGLTLVTALLFFIISVWRYIWGLPVFWTRWRRANRLKRSEGMFMEGLTTLLSGELDQAGSMAAKAISLNPKCSLNHLLLAKIAYRSQNYEAAEGEFLSLSQNPVTAFMGLKGLYQIAAKRKDLNQMRHVLRQALAIHPNSPWALTRLFQLDLKAGSFEKAERIMEQLAISQEIPPKQSAHQLGIVYWLRAKHLGEAGDQDGFLKYANKAFKVAPELTELAVSLAEFYLKSGQDAKSKRLIKEAYGANPHPDLVIVWENLYAEKTGLELYQEIELLTASVSHHSESLAALAKMAIKAKLWGQARQHLNDLLKAGEVSRTYYLLAELAEAENPNNPRLAQDWMRKAVLASPAHTCRCSSCGCSSKTWEAFCSKCNCFDTVGWGGGSTVLK